MTADESRMRGVATADEALDLLRAASRVAAPEHDDAVFVVGAVGHDVPVEAIAAAGAAPRRLRGNPAWDLGPADRYLGRGLDPATRSILVGLLEGAYGRLDAIVISSDCDASQRLYYALRELRRVEPGVRIPPVHLIDILHLPRTSTTNYNAVRLAQFLDVLHDWTGTRPTAERLVAEAARADEIRGLQRDVMALRRVTPARLSGTDALAVFAAADRLPRDAYAAALRILIERGRELEPRHGRRVFLTGSSHDTPHVYEQLEAAGAVVVGEDHIDGELQADRDVAVDGESDPDRIVRDLALRYQCNGPTPQRASVGDRAERTARGVARCGAELVLAYVRARDEAPLWDFAAQREAAGVPAAVVTQQPYGRIDADALAGALAAPQLTGVNA